MIVPQAEIYELLKNYRWIFRDTEFDLYSIVDIDDDDNLTFQLNKLEFLLDNFRITGKRASIDAACRQQDVQASFTFTGIPHEGDIF